MTLEDAAAGKTFRSVEATPNRTIVGRLLPGADLIRGLEAVCDLHGLRYASIASAYGSLSSATFKILQLRPETGPRPTLTSHHIDRRVEFLGGQGLICDDGNGQRATHLHGAVSDETGQVMGGHFEPGVNPVYNNMDFTLTELLDVELSRVWDEDTGTVEMVVKQITGGAA
jgi:uncharacterized protein